MRSLRKFPSVLVAVSVFLATEALTREGWAQSNKTLAELTFRKGQDEIKKGNLAEACQFFAESQKLDPQLGTLVALAACHEKQGRIATAWGEYQEASQMEGKPALYAKKRYQALEKLIPRIQIKIADVPEGMVAKLNKTEVSRTILKLSESDGMPIDPGDHTFVVVAPGKKTWTRTFKIEASQKPEPLLITLENEEKKLPDSGDKKPPDGKSDNKTDGKSDNKNDGKSDNKNDGKSDNKNDGKSDNKNDGKSDNKTDGKSDNKNDGSSSRSTLRTIGWLSLGAGILAGINTAAFSVLTIVQDGKRADAAVDPNLNLLQRQREAEDWRNKALTSQTIAIVSGVFSGLTVATGIVLLVVAPSDSAKTQGASRFVLPTMAYSPQTGPTFGLVGRF